MTKYEKISVLAKETARSIRREKKSWMNYLDVASRLYKYPFEDQILIYAQRRMPPPVPHWKCGMRKCFAG